MNNVVFFDMKKCYNLLVKMAFFLLKIDYKLRFNKDSFAIIKVTYMNKNTKKHESQLILSDLTDEIITNWEEKLRKNISRTHGKSSTLLIDHLPYILRNLTAVLENNGKRIKKQETDELNKKHGIQRASQTDFSLEEIMYEYALLRDVIIELMFKRSLPDLKTEQIIHQFIDECVQTTVLEFTKYQTDLIKKQTSDLELEKGIRERFISALTHDLRTPLAAAVMSIEMILKRSEVNAFQEKYLSRATGQLNRLESMIQDFLDVNLIKAGRPAPINYTTFNINELVKDTIQDLTLIFGERFELTEHTNINVSLGQKAIKRIIENLCTNAIKYGVPSGKVGIELAERDKSLFISVHNDGDPIDQDTLETIFQLFSRSKDAWVNSTKGWGIGLPLVKGLTEAQGGEIKIDSAKHKGTTFTLKFPIKNTNESAHS